ncbi:Lrp/AsnC family transcriptional regulator [Jiangella sp. DSM 45060]|uniref:Lrp/AsnC family transcriptional regulator n=1 Tax=Jiangella sp. DSM 45060 TaxID=1798224 RepID=UPI00087CEA51|nr:Lrp/AsnC family transcriptional regulator [Jiangella sp. DSM 45060]SDR97705.1 Lrp/AsnC family transcriptional regulator, leucine-responsive regulatory protein [Jiangella sp. DSM 45060]
MADDSAAALDRVDWQLLEHLQRDGRVAVAELARRVNLGPSATADRIRRLTDLGVIAGFRAELDLERIGYTVIAYVRLRYPSGNYRALHAELDRTQELLECHHVTGDDCFVLKVAARSMRHLEELAGRLATLGSVTTSVVYSSPLVSRVISRPDAQPSAGMTSRSNSSTPLRS